MTSNKQKGDKTEKEVMAILQSQGYNVIRSPRTMKRIFTPKGIMFISQANDFWGLFDLCAKVKDGAMNKTYWIQCKFKTPDNVYTAKKDIEDFNVGSCCPHEETQIWLKVPRKGFIIYKYLYGTWEKIYVDLHGNNKEPFNVEVKIVPDSKIITNEIAKRIADEKIKMVRE